MARDAEARAANVALIPAVGFDVPFPRRGPRPAIAIPSGDLATVLCGSRGCNACSRPRSGSPPSKRS